MARTMTNREVPLISSDRPARRSSTYANVLEGVGTSILRYGLVAILLYFGHSSFTQWKRRALNHSSPTAR